MDPETVEVTASAGKLRGLVKKSEIAKKKYYSYQGIPYAKPPIEELRFQAPVPHGKWEGVRDATKEGSDSLQIHMIFKTLTGSEDCLYLNVYTPVEPSENVSKKAVMVWFHGGGFGRGSGSSEFYGPDFLIEHDIVLVTVNYRCGVLGFLSLGTASCPGNAGLKDQAMALQWVNQNIASFGGDPGNVTIFGESAGGGSVNYHMISPLSKGLFHKAIIQSGSVLCPWSLQPHPRDLALRLAKELGCTSEDLDDVLKFLLAVPAEDIGNAKNTNTPSNEKDNIQRFGYQWLPCVEVAGDSPFLPDFPRKLMEEGKINKVPTIIGATNMEGLLWLALKDINLERVNEDVTTLVPVDLTITKGSEEEKNLAREILKFYSGKESLSWNVEDILAYINLLSDIGFVLGIETSRQLFLKHNVPLYTYSFCYNSDRSLSHGLLPGAYPDLAPNFTSYGTAHGDDLVYIFKQNTDLLLPFFPPNEEDAQFIAKFLKVWTNFAKTGNPNCSELGVEWQPDHIDKPLLMEIGKEWTTKSSVALTDKMEFWKSIYDKYSHSY